MIRAAAIATILSILTFAVPASAEDPYDEKILQLADTLSAMLSNAEPGASVIVTHGDEIIFEEYYGLADVEKSERLGPDHVIGIASMTKQFTGMAILFLVEEGKLALEDDIREYFPDLPVGDRKITIRQLLSHTSGMPELTQNENFMNTIDRARTIEQIIDLAFEGDFRSEAGEKYIYCNTGFTIAAALIEKLSGMKYSAFLDEKIFRPLEMENTFACDFERDADGAVQRYISGPDGYGKAIVMHFSNLIGGGSIISNSRDIAKWTMALLSGKNLPGNYEKLWDQTLLSSGEPIGYGLGMGISETKGKTFYYHPGMGDGMNSIDLIFPDDDVTVNVIRNDSDPKHTSREIALLAAAYLFTQAE